MELQTSKLGKVGITVEKEPWDITKNYDKLVIVRSEEESAAYISRKEVPINIPITNTEYWVKLSSESKENKPEETEPNHVCYIIDQSLNIRNPKDRVSHNFIKDDSGNLIEVSENGFTGTSDTNFLKYLREHTHAYIGIYDSSNSIMKLKQLHDFIGNTFADGTDATDYINFKEDSHHINVWVKFDIDIYFKTESYFENKILVTIANSKLDNNVWEKISSDTLIGAFEASSSDNGNPFARSIGGVKPYNGDFNYFKKGINNSHCKILDYNIHTLMALLFYGYYGTLDSQSICGYGSRTYNDESSLYYPKVTNLSGSALMLDTDVYSGTSDIIDNTIITDGNNPTLKSIRFWGLENWWGDCQEFIDATIMGMYSGGSGSADLYLDSYIALNGSQIVTINGKDVEMSVIGEEYVDHGVIKVPNNDGYRFIHIGSLDTQGVHPIMMLGNHSDILPISSLEVHFDTSVDYADYITINANDLGCYLCRGGYSNIANGGITALESVNINYSDKLAGKCVTRIMYVGDSIIVNDFN